MIQQHTLKNGLTIIGQTMKSVGSVAINFMIPCGASTLPKGCDGLSALLSDWIIRGAAENNSKQLSDKLDNLGLHRHTSIGSSFMTFSVVMESSNLDKAIDLYGDILLSPQLKDDQFALAKQLAMDEVASLADDPRQKVMLELREKFYPAPLGNITIGKLDTLKKLDPQRVRDIYAQNFNLSETIISIAGNYDFDLICRKLEQKFSFDQSIAPTDIEIGSKGPLYSHIDNDGAQIHIGMMTETVTETDPDYYNAISAITILSGSMSSRLFTEVREKRGLCYAIGAHYHSLKTAAGIMTYAGTTVDKAQETFDVIKTEFNRLRDGVSEDEVQIAKTGLKSRLIMQSESTANRAAGIGSDYFIFGKARPLTEIKKKIEQLTIESINSFLKKDNFGQFTVVTIGPNQINIG